MADIVSMARIELIEDPRFGHLYTGPVPVIRGTRFPPLQEVRIEVSCTCGHGRQWKSSNSYLVSADGIFDTSLTASVGDGYYGIAREGPFYSMVCQSDPGKEFGSRRLSSLTYRIAAFDGSEEIWAKEVTRYMTGGSDLEPWVQVMLFDDDVASDLRDTTESLAPYGVVVINREPSVPEMPTFVVASGRSSGRALETAMTLNDLAGVVLFSGGGLRFDPIRAGSADGRGQWAEEELSYIPLDHSSLQPKADDVLITRKLYAEAVADKNRRELGRIQAEKVACPIYMFSGLDDQIWPSSAFSELVVQRRKLKGCPFPTYHRTFEAVGHDIGPSLGLPTLPTTERTVQHPDTGFRLLLGGKPGRQARARREAWNSLLAILSGQGPAASPGPDP